MNTLRRNIDNPPFLIMMIGLPGSGKSTYGEEIEIDCAVEKHKPIIHSSDALRAELYGNASIQGDNNALFQELHKRIKEDLRNGKDVIYDATNIKKKLRRQFLTEMKSVSCCPIAICMMTPFEVCCSNNLQRDRQVPYEAIKRMYMNWQPPEYREGFDDILYVFSCHSSEYTIQSFFEKANKFDQENKHHALSLGEHCTKAATYIQETDPDDFYLLLAALMHDNGKIFTKTRVNAKGIEDGDCHYYQHHCVGAYDSILYFEHHLNAEKLTYVANLIYYHMHPYVEWKQSEKCHKRDRELLGEDMYMAVQKLHRADVYAH